MRTDVPILSGCFRIRHNNLETGHHESLEIPRAQRTLAWRSSEAPPRLPRPWPSFALVTEPHRASQRFGLTRLSLYRRISLLSETWVQSEIRHMKRMKRMKKPVKRKRLTGPEETTTTSCSIRLTDEAPQLGHPSTLYSERHNCSVSINHRSASAHLMRKSSMSSRLLSG